MSGRVRGNKKLEESGKDKLAALKTAYFDYIRLSKTLFAHTMNPPYDINELPADSEFYKPAKSMAEELEIDWKKMSHEDSNRIMLALLEEYYNKMAEMAETTDIVISVNFKLNTKQNSNEQGQKK